MENRLFKYSIVQFEILWFERINVAVAVFDFEKGDIGIRENFKRAIQFSGGYKKFVEMFAGGTCYILKEMVLHKRCGESEIARYIETRANQIHLTPLKPCLGSSIDEILNQSVGFLEDKTKK